MKTQSLALLSLTTLFLGCSTSIPAHADAQVAPSRILAQAEAKLGPAEITDPRYHPGLIRHIVMFRYQPTVTEQEKAEVIRRFLALQHLALRGGREYILSIETGPQISGEGVDQGLEQAFVVSFRSEGDRNYYVGQPVVTDARFYDPAHQAFKDFVGKLLHLPINPTGVVVFDYPVRGRTQPSAR